MTPKEELLNACKESLKYFLSIPGDQRPMGLVIMIERAIKKGEES